MIPRLQQRAGTSLRFVPRNVLTPSCFPRLVLLVLQLSLSAAIFSERLGVSSPLHVVGKMFFLFSAVSLRQHEGLVFPCLMDVFHASVSVDCCIGSGKVSDALSGVTCPLSPLLSARVPLAGGRVFSFYPVSRPCLARRPSCLCCISGDFFGPVFAPASSLVGRVDSASVSHSQRARSSLFSHPMASSARFCLTRRPFPFRHAAPVTASGALVRVVCCSRPQT